MKVCFVGREITPASCAEGSSAVLSWACLYFYTTPPWDRVTRGSEWASACWYNHYHFQPITRGSGEEPGLYQKGHFRQRTACDPVFHSAPGRSVPLGGGGAGHLPRAGETQNLRSSQVLMPHGLKKWMNHLSSNYCLLPTPSFCSSPPRPSLTRAPRRPENMDSQEGDPRGALYCTVGEWWVN